MRINALISNITSGTPVNLAVALGLVANNAALAAANPILGNRIDVQMGFGATVGVGYYMDLANFAAGTVANKATAGHLTQQLAPGTATVPGATWTDAAAGIGFGAPRDITRIWIDVATSNSPVVVSVDLRN
jgi:hypothetical protein